MIEVVLLYVFLCLIIPLSKEQETGFYTCIQFQLTSFTSWKTSMQSKLLQKLSVINMSSVEIPKAFNNYDKAKKTTTNK